MLQRDAGQRLKSALLVALAGAAGCVGIIGGDDGDLDAPPTDVAVSGLRRLTIDEYNNTLADLLGDTSRPGVLLLPFDSRTPFDNDYTDQVASQALIEGAELLAADASARLLADPLRRDEVLGCVPTAPDDEECFLGFIARFGRLAYRRSLTSEELAAYAELAAVGIAQGDFYAGIDTALRSFLQAPEFLYRVEVGTEASPGVYRLGGTEMASRLSYLLWGTMPDAQLLDEAESGALDTSAEIETAARRMLADPRARTRIARFHELWLGYEALPAPADLAVAMRAETQALLDRIIFEEQRPWHDVFLLDETFVPGALAEHYGLASYSEEPSWVPYTGSERRGLLSHGSYLAAGTTGGETSPTLRGLAVRTRLFCQEISPPPPEVNVDAGPASEAECKLDRFAEHAEGGCANCHKLMDPIGFGLEQYDSLGRFRSHEPDNPECPIDGTGELDGLAFVGPGGLGEVAVESGLLEPCVVEQLYRYTVGRSKLDKSDRTIVRELTGQVGADMRFDELLLAIVSRPSFRFRRDDASEEE
jgi:hypothetical protein